MSKDTTMFGTKVKNLITNELGVVINTWTNVFADGEIPFANGKRYNIKIDSLELLEA